MIRTLTPKLTAIALAAILAAILVPASVWAAEPETHDLTKAFVDAGLKIDQLRVTEVGGIVVVRGRAAEQTEVENASRVAQSLGYKRVANLVELIDIPDDLAIARIAERQLTSDRALDGCNFTVGSRRGILHVAGKVRYELQKDVAIQVLRNISGVRGVLTDFRRF